MQFVKKLLGSDRFLLGSSVLCLVAAIMLLGVRDRQLYASAYDDEEFLRFVDVAAEIYNEVQSKYVDDTEPSDVLESALAGMFNALDEHSQYMSPKMLDSLNKDTEGEFSGIGIHITMRQGLLTVIAPIPGSPSAQLGIAPWDRIIEIDGETTEGMNLQEAVDKLTGPAGTQVKVKIFREGEPDPLEFEITRASIKIESVHYHMMDGEEKIGYLRIARFSENTATDMRRGVLDLKSQGMRGMILDLRYNTGGLLREAIEVSNLFVPKSEMIVSTKGRLRSNTREYRATEEPIFGDLPLFVLVNEGSASASEIVAGALQDHKLGVIVGPEGKNTFGKGSVQTIEVLSHSLYNDEDGNPKDSAIRLTTARYYVPSGRTIHHIGITPDIGIPLPEGHERDLLRHGLYGDTTIPITKEEVERRKALEEAQQQKEEESTEEAPSSIKIQRKESNPEDVELDVQENEADDSVDSVPFYSKATRPEFADDDFEDIMLREAMNQMKIYLILDGTHHNAQPAVADVSSNTLSKAVTETK